MESKHFMKGAAIGAIIASVATVLLAPKSGKKTRSDVKKLVTTLSKKMTKQLEEISDLSKESYEDLVNKTVKEYTKGKKLTKDFVNDISEVLKSNWKEIQQELKKK